MNIDELTKLDTTTLFSNLQEGKCFQDVLGWSDTRMNDLYDCLKELNTQQRWDDAIDAATFLLSVNPYIGPFYLEAGFAYQNKQCIEEAISLYSLATLHNVDDPQAFLYLVTCYQTLGDSKNAIKSLESAIFLIQTGPTQRWAGLLDNLQETLTVLKETDGSPSL